MKTEIRLPYEFSSEGDEMRYFRPVEARWNEISREVRSNFPIMLQLPHDTRRNPHDVVLTLTYESK